MNHYEILGVGRKATAAEIRTAYLRLAREKHPDRFTDPAEKERAQEFFKSLTTAFNTLTNEKSRREYDLELEQPRPTGPAETAEDAFARASKLVASGNHQGAVGWLRIATHNAPDEARYHAALGRALLGTPGGMRDAVASLERAVALAPRQAEYHACLAEAFLAQGMKLRARRMAEESQRLNPRDREVVRVLKLFEKAGEPL